MIQRIAKYDGYRLEFRYMAGEQKTVEYMTAADGTRYKVVLTPVKTPAAEILPKSDLKLKRIASRKRKILMSVLVIALLVGAGIFYKSQHSNNPFPKSITSTINFPLYYPKVLPENVTVEPGSIQKLANGTVIFVINYAKGKQLTVSEQALPANFQGTILSNTETLTTKLGTAYVGVYGDHPVGIIVTKKTLLFFNDPSGLDTVKLRQILEAY